MSVTITSPSALEGWLLFGVLVFICSFLGFGLGAILASLGERRKDGALGALAVFTCISAIAFAIASFVLIVQAVVHMFREVT